MNTTIESPKTERDNANLLTALEAAMPSKLKSKMEAELLALRSKPKQPEPSPVAEPTPEVEPESEATLRTNGPTLEEYVARGYKAENYPPRGYAVRTSSASPPEPPAKVPQVQASAEPEPEKVYFRKVGANIKAKDRSGKPIEFERYSTSGLGILALNPETDAALIEDLTGYIQAGRLGLARVTKEYYDSVKKNQTPFIPFEQRLTARTKIFDPNQFLRPGKPVDPAKDAAKSEPAVPLSTVQSAVVPDANDRSKRLIPVRKAPMRGVEA